MEHRQPGALREARQVGADSRQVGAHLPAAHPMRDPRTIGATDMALTLVWLQQPARDGITLHFEGCRHLKPEAWPTLYEPSWHGQVVEGAPLQPLWVHTCRNCLRRRQLLEAAQGNR